MNCITIITIKIDCFIKEVVDILLLICCSFLFCFNYFKTKNDEMIKKKKE
jgi:hypothetical protein